MPTPDPCRTAQGSEKRERGCGRVRQREGERDRERERETARETQGCPLPENAFSPCRGRRGSCSDAGRPSLSKSLHPISYALNPIPYTLYPIPYTLYPIPYTPYPMLCTLSRYPLPYTLHRIPYTPYPKRFGWAGAGDIAGGRDEASEWEQNVLL